MRCLFPLFFALILGCGGQKNINDPSSAAKGPMTVIYQGPLSPGSMPHIQSLWEVGDVGKGVTPGAVQFTLRLTLENDQIKTVVVSRMEAMCELFPKSRSLPGLITVDTTFSDGRHTHEADPAKPDIWQGFQHAKSLKELCQQAGIPFG
jgi:hypothetical protein